MMKKFQGYFAYCMGMGLLAPIIGGFPVNNYSRFLISITAVSLVLSVVYLLLDKQVDQLIKSLIGRKEQKTKVTASGRK